MPSPFPGMDPFVELQEWDDFHAKFNSAISDALQPQVAPRYIVRAERRVYVESPGEIDPLFRRPDVSVLWVGDRGGAVSQWWPSIDPSPTRSSANCQCRKYAARLICDSLTGKYGGRHSFGDALAGQQAAGRRRVARVPLEKRKKCWTVHRILSSWICFAVEPLAHGDFTAGRRLLRDCKPSVPPSPSRCVRMDASRPLRRFPFRSRRATARCRLTCNRSSRRYTIMPDTIFR